MSVMQKHLNTAKDFVCSKLCNKTVKKRILQELKDVAILKKHLNTVQEMVCSKRYKNDGPIDDAAKVVVENIMKAGM